MKKVLVIAAHPDDEVLGCGGTIADHARQGDEVHILILAEGATSRNSIREREKCLTQLSELTEAAQKASEILGAKSVALHDFPDNRMDSVDLLDVVKVIESHLSAIAPEIVYTHHAGDVNIDHRQVYEAVVTACRPQPLHSVKTVLFFEILSSTEWQTADFGRPYLPNWYVDISETLHLKTKALETYRSEMRPWPHSRSLQAAEHLARWRGASIGCEAAEAFVLGRHIVSGVRK